MNDISNLPFRTDVYESSDADYTIRMKELYKIVPLNIQNKFDNYTKNLMECDIISQKELLKAIDGFELYYYNIPFYNDVTWNDFLTHAYSRYSHCIIL